MSDDIPDRVPQERISSAPDEMVYGSEKNALQELPMLAHEQEMLSKELGWFGKIFGGRAEKAGNISGHCCPVESERTARKWLCCRGLSMILAGVDLNSTLPAGAVFRTIQARCHR